MPVPVVLKYTLPCTVPKPICEVAPLFPFPPEPCDPTIIPVEIGTWPPCANPPPGTILSKETGVVPSGYLACDGAEVSRTVYAKLFAVIGVYYGEGNGTTTFNLPKLVNDCNPNVMYIINADTQVDLVIIGGGSGSSIDSGGSGSGGSGDFGSGNIISANVQILPYPLDAVPPPGTILHNTLNYLPRGYLLCNGSNVSRDTYSVLYNMIGVYYGAGDGSTTFTLPNLIINSNMPFQYIIRYDAQIIPNVNVFPHLTVSGVTLTGLETFECI